MGPARYPNARSLLISADGGGSNGSRVRLWKTEPQKLADEFGVAITICHLPTGTSKRNKIKHRLFSFITGNWHGNPLPDCGNDHKNRSRGSLPARPNSYPADIKVSDTELEGVNLIRWVRLAAHRNYQPF